MPHQSQSRRWVFTRLTVLRFLCILASWLAPLAAPWQQPSFRSVVSSVRSYHRQRPRQGRSCYLLLSHRRVFSRRLSATDDADATASRPMTGPLPPDYQEHGQDCILQAARALGLAPDQVNVVWKPGRIIVTVSDAAAAGLLGEEEEFEEDLDLEWSGDDDDEEEGDFDDMFEEEDYPEEESSTKIDLSELARAINSALDDGEGNLGTRIASTHEIEVTTPGASDELHYLPTRLINSYRGFDVTVVFVDRKKEKQNTVQAKFVERDGDVTTINIKGRMKKIHQNDIESIKLPKAKKEKGAAR